MYFKVMKKGFTLIEIIVVLAILGLVLGIGIPVFRNSTASRELESATQELSASLNYAQQIARAEGSASIDFTKPPAGKAPYCGYSVVDASGNIKMQKDIPSSVNLSSFASAVSYNTNGTTTSGGDITLSSKVTSQSKVITVNQATGMITTR